MLLLPLLLLLLRSGDVLGLFPPPPCLQIMTRKATMAIAKYAFEFALLNNRKKVTAVHKVCFCVCLSPSA